MSDHGTRHVSLTEDARLPAQARAIADQDLTPCPSDVAVDPSSNPHDRRLRTSPQLQNETGLTPEQVEQILTDLQASERVALEDRELADREIRRLRREADALRRELQEAREEDPRAKLIREVCNYWITTLGKTKRTKCPTNGARWNKVRCRMNDGYTVEQLKKAVDGCALMPFVGPHGRQADAERGAKRHDDLELICRDETTVERFIGYTDKTEPDEPESIERQFVRYAYGDECKLQHRPASREPRSRSPHPGAPIDKVLGALHSYGCQVVAYQAHADQWSAQCPAHEDRDPSLSIHRKPDGQILLHCWASCSTDEVVAALGLEWRDLWEESDWDTNRAGVRRDPEIPPHLRHAMQQLLTRDERSAA